MSSTRGGCDVLHCHLDGGSVEVTPTLRVIQRNSQVAEVGRHRDFQVAEVGAVEHDALGVTLSPPDTNGAFESEVTAIQIIHIQLITQTTVGAVREPPLRTCAHKRKIR